MPDIFFYLLAGLIVVCGLGMMTSRNVFHSAIFLAVVLTLVGGLYLLLNAEFLAIVQILVYVGAVVILIIFAVMLTSQLGDPRLTQSNRLSLPAFLACVVFLGLFIPLLTAEPWGPTPPTANPSGLNNIQAIGQGLLTTYTFPFEVASLALLAALVGAIVIARKDP